MVTEQASPPHMDWFEETYATSPTPSLIVDEQEDVVFCNRRAHTLLGIDTIENLEDLAPPKVLPNGAGLDEVIRRALNPKNSLISWKGWLAVPEPRPLKVQFVRLPGPSLFLLCRLIPYREVDHETQVQVISELAEIHRHDKCLEKAGMRLAQCIHKHLDTAVVVLWYRDGLQNDSWTAGDEKLCHEMAAAQLPEPSATSNKITAFRTATDLRALNLSLATGQDSSAALLIATGVGRLEANVSSPFWTCLAATAGTTLHSAHLLELNRQERLRLRAVIEHMPTAVAIFDPQGTVLDLNLRARAMVGRRSWNRLRPDEQPFEILDIDGQKLPHEQWPFIRAIRGGDLCEEEEFILDFGDRQRTVSLTVLPITNDRGAISSYVATGRDVTERSEEERRKDEFLSVASHELRSPLTPLAGLLQLSRKQAESARPVDPEILYRAESQIERLERLIDSLLDMSRIETGKLPIRRQPIDMRRLVHRILMPWLEGPTAGRIEAELPEQAVEAHLDPDRIDQVLTNVIDNAAKHGRADGTIEVRLDADEQNAIITVSDEGDGMPQEVIDRVFERYFFVPGASSSTGLGLYISRQIVDDHDGTIAIDSAPGQPTTVTITLPRHT